MKEKLLASAQKNLQKGQLAKAIKDYQKLVGADPRDIRHRQKLAELCSRAKMIDEALEEYETVAKHFSDSGFYLKAIAVYKQMQKLDSTQARFYLRLAELNEKQGLVGNALAEYRHLVAFYEKQKMLSEAIDILQKMKVLEPENLNIRVKIAESYVQTHHSDKARVEFQEVLAKLEEKKDHPRILKLYEIFLPLFPDDAAMKAGLANTFIMKGEAEKGIHLLKSLLKNNPGDASVLHILAKSYRATGDFENERLTYQHLLKSNPGDLDFQEAFARACLDSGEASRALEVLEQSKGAFMEADRLASLKGLYEALQSALPGNQRVGQSLRSIYEATGEGDKLFDVLSDTTDFAALSAASAPEDTDGPPGELQAEPLEELDEVAELSDEIEELEPSDELGEPETEIEPLSLEPEEEFETAEIDLAEDQDIEMELEIEIDEEADIEELSEPEEYVDLEMDGAPEELTANAAPEVSSDSDVDSSLMELDFDEDITSLDTAPVVDYQADLEEAEFYLQQDLLDEAERICQRLIEADPTLFEAREKLDEIQARRSESLPEAENEEEYFDLAAEIMDDGAFEATEGLAGVDEADRFRFDGVFSEFKKGVEKQIEVDDAEAHYNLGIAYKEMGLLDDAIAEFEKTMKNPSRFVDCTTLKGICLAEKGSFENSEKTFKNGLAFPSLDDEERISLYYELGLLYEVWGKPKEAFECFKKVAAADSFFRNVAEKLTILGKELGITAPEDNDVAPKNKKDRVSYV